MTPRILCNSFVMDMPRSSADEMSPWQWEDTGVTDVDVLGRKIGPKGESTWLNVSPAGFRSMLNWISKRCVFSRSTHIYLEIDQPHHELGLNRVVHCHTVVLVLRLGPLLYPTMGMNCSRIIVLSKIAPMC